MQRKTLIAIVIAMALILCALLGVCMVLDSREVTPPQDPSDTALGTTAAPPEESTSVDTTEPATTADSVMDPTGPDTTVPSDTTPDLTEESTTAPPQTQPPGESTAPTEEEWGIGEF